MEAVLSAVAERHYDVRWQCAAAADSASHINTGDQYILLNANGYVTVGLCVRRLHSFFRYVIFIPQLRTELSLQSLCYMMFCCFIDDQIDADQLGVPLFLAWSL
jgi:hypothetical protein